MNSGATPLANAPGTAMPDLSRGGQADKHAAAGKRAVPQTLADQPIGMMLEVDGSGGLVAIDPERLAQCATSDDPAVTQTGQVGHQIKIRSGGSWLLASVLEQRQDRRGSKHIIARISFSGEGLQDTVHGGLTQFRRGVTRYPIPGTHIFPVTTGDLRDIYATRGEATISIGTVYPTRDIRASVDIDGLLGKHFALIGSTGTGKSSSAALLLHRICDSSPQGHVVMIDPHGEYGAAFRDKGMIYDVSNIQMPYWLMNFEEHCEVLLHNCEGDNQADRDILAKCLMQARSRNRLAERLGRITVDSPIPYLLSELSTLVQDEMGKLDKPTNTAPYMRIKTRIDELRVDPRYQFMFSGMLVSDSMGDFLAKIFRLPGDGSPISIIDVSGVPSEITSTVVAVLSRLVFDYALWSRDEATSPILLVCEEAHRYIPNERNADGSSVARILSRIAKEGRKYGVSLGLITQRPSDLAEGVLSQCGTIIAMRLNNDRDQAFVKAAMPEGARGFLDAIPALRNREAIICGEGVSIPVRIGFDYLEEEHRPASEDPSFSKLWRSTSGERDQVDRAVERWRMQGR